MYQAHPAPALHSPLSTAPHRHATRETDMRKGCGRAQPSGWIQRVSRVASQARHPRPRLVAGPAAQCRALARARLLHRAHLLSALSVALAGCDRTQVVSGLLEHGPQGRRGRRGLSLRGSQLPLLGTAVATLAPASPLARLRRVCASRCGRGAVAPFATRPLIWPMVSVC